MRIVYHFPRLSRQERERLEALMVGEMDLQEWYAVAYSRMLAREILIFRQ